MIHVRIPDPEAEKIKQMAKEAVRSEAGEVLVAVRKHIKTKKKSK